MQAFLVLTLETAQITISWFVTMCKSCRMVPTFRRNTQPKPTLPDYKLEVLMLQPTFVVLGHRTAWKTENTDVTEDYSASIFKF
jgi:hypothetical protein